MDRYSAIPYTCHTAQEKPKRILKVSTSYKLGTPIFFSYSLIQQFSIEKTQKSNTVLGAGHTELNEVAKSPYPQAADIPIENWENNKQTNYKVCERVRNVMKEK